VVVGVVVVVVVVVVMVVVMVVVVVVLTSMWNPQSVHTSVEGTHAQANKSLPRSSDL
jgi:cytoskeletal protein RodZ